VVYWAAIALVILAGGYLTVGLLVAVRLGAPNRQPPERTPANVGLEYHDVSFESTDGVPLAAWWIPSPDERFSRVAVLVHGWEGDKSDLHTVETSQVYARAGYGVLMIDLRGNPFLAVLRASIPVALGG
jgi:predicted alpha/beta-fold hydrolase